MLSSLPKTGTPLIVCLVLVSSIANIVSGSSPSVFADTPELDVTVETNKEVYAKGESVAIVVILSNRGPDPITLHFSSTCQATFTVEDADSVLYDERLHVACGLAFTDVTVPPGGSVSYSSTWTQIDNTGNQVPVPSDLTVSGIILHIDDIPPLEGTASIKLREGGSPPMAAFTWEPCFLCMAPGNVVFFNANVSAGFLVQYTWNFGDGSDPVKTTDPFMSHVFFSSRDISTVSLTVLNSEGMTDTVSHQISFSIIPHFSFQPEQPRPGKEVTFNASASLSYGPEIVGFQWAFGDGTTGTGILTSHSYRRPGVYRVVLTLLTEKSGFSVSKTITVALRGDLNNDCAVNIFDMVIIGRAYGSTPDDAEWNPEADINHDLRVNIVDAAIGGSEYGETCL